nr:MAG TPA: hypothetical protein [Caudoviricetes sp.]
MEYKIKKPRRKRCGHRIGFSPYMAKTVRTKNTENAKKSPKAIKPRLKYF